MLYAEVDPLARDRYFTFATLREPASRLLSAYHEVSVRFEHDPTPAPTRRFFLMGDTPERFKSFLGELDDGRWDPHLRPQVDYLSGVRVDCFARVETLQQDVEQVFRTLDLGQCPFLPARRSRSEAHEHRGVSRYEVTADDLDCEAAGQIAGVYADDVRLYTKVSGSAG